MSTWDLFFAWPAGGVWSNVIASVICFAVAWLWARRHIRLLHRQVRDLHARHDETHRRVTELHDQLIAAAGGATNDENESKEDGA